MPTSNNEAHAQLISELQGQVMHVPDMLAMFTSWPRCGRNKWYTRLKSRLDEVTVRLVPDECLDGGLGAPWLIALFLEYSRTRRSEGEPRRATLLFSRACAKEVPRPLMLCMLWLTSKLKLVSGCRLGTARGPRPLLVLAIPPRRPHGRKRRLPRPRLCLIVPPPGSSPPAHAILARA
jgi:hypothetical protein